MIKFILNNTEISTDEAEGIPLLHFIRYSQHLIGTKTGCNEGDCGACTVLIGEVKHNIVQYKSATSCLTPLGNVMDKHVVTIEGINISQNRMAKNKALPLTPVQSVMCQNGATQCGFCTPGFIMSLTGYCLSAADANSQNITNAIDGNICRCTGYKSIQRAADKVASLMAENTSNSTIDFLIEKQIVPAYFLNIQKRLLQLSGKFAYHPINNTEQTTIVGGGTDLYVQKHDELLHTPIRCLSQNNALKQISFTDNVCEIGSMVTISEIFAAEKLIQFFPNWKLFEQLISSTPIRNIATAAGNFVNASPIGDLSIIFLALNAQIVLSSGHTKRKIALQDFFLAYKKTDRLPEEIIETILFTLPDKNALFNFEKVSKRTHLDIASVNTAIVIKSVDNIITNTKISAGGVGPVPMLLKNAAEFLQQKSISHQTIERAIEIAQLEILPISDARGTEAYKRLLLGQLIKAHFMQLFPNLFS